MARSGKHAGFTLTEVMTVVVIIGLLAAVAFPSYQNHVRKAKRAEGKAALLKAAQYQERNLTANNTYLDSANLAVAFGLANGAVIYSAENPGDASGAYRITVDAPTAGCPIASCFSLTAAPNGGHTDPDCGNLTLNSAGVRGRSGTAAMSICW
jgi:type IV pilus assembly protein PilE